MPKVDDNAAEERYAKSGVFAQSLRPVQEKSSPKISGNFVASVFRIAFVVALIMALLGVFGVYIPFVSPLGSLIGKAIFTALAGKASRFGLFMLLLPMIGYSIGYLVGHKIEE